MTLSFIIYFLLCIFLLEHMHQSAKLTKLGYFYKILTIQKINYILQIKSRYHDVLQRRVMQIYFN